MKDKMTNETLMVLKTDSGLYMHIDSGLRPLPVTRAKHAYYAGISAMMEMVKWVQDCYPRFLNGGYTLISLELALLTPPDEPS